LQTELPATQSTSGFVQLVCSQWNRTGLLRDLHTSSEPVGSQVTVAPAVDGSLESCSGPDLPEKLQRKSCCLFIRHHAQANQPNGFCVFNNVAIAARYAQKRHAVSRVLIVDWDVHHGQGIQYLFQGDS
ncbi:hypothetical protein GOODEAATRI_028801, partial [Goodea atripinnis]